MCMECYADESRITLLLNPIDCLGHHIQYIWGLTGDAFALNMSQSRGIDILKYK